MSNKLYFGDNLDVLKKHIKSESIDLIYLDPPFNSKATYNVLYKEPGGGASRAQVQAFEDTWHWGIDAASAFDEILAGGSAAAGIMNSLRSFLGENDMMAYLTMMTVRLVELHRVLKPHGSLYLHCDPTASHYLKIVLDAIFGPASFVNEISWRRTTAKADHTQGATHFPRLRDTIFLFRKNPSIAPTFNQPFTTYSDDYIADKYKWADADGRRYTLSDMTGPGGTAKGNPEYEVMGVTRPWRYSRDRMERFVAEGRVVQPSPGAVPRYKRYLDEMPGIPLGDDWGDIRPINSQAEERLGYPTQKPVSLLKRIICASSNPGDVVLDPFCGCGTAVHAAQELGRNWIGIDVTHIAIQIIQDRLKKYFPAERPEVFGRPEDLSGARELSRRDKYQFQWWASSLLGGQARGGERKGPDRGIDGEIFFKRSKKTYGRAIISVKGGENVGPSMIRDLAGTRDREGADMGIFVCLNEPTRDMKATAASYGTFDRSYPRIAIVTVEELLQRQSQLTLPPAFNSVTVRDEARKRGAQAKPRKPSDVRQQPEFMLTISGGKTSKGSASKQPYLPIAWAPTKTRRKA